MRIGTLRCWLFGHKFIGQGRPEVINDRGFYGNWYPNVQTSFCVRCGIDKPKGNL